ncbi:MAG TPA: glutathione S-transferase N-terminal domain-containing protein [Sphingomonas sp.]
MRLYTHPLSANAHKVKLLLGFLGLPHDELVIDIPAGEQREPAFLAVSALGQIPVLEDGGVRIRDA